MVSSLMLTLKLFFSVEIKQIPPFLQNQLFAYVCQKLIRNHLASSPGSGPTCGVPVKDPVTGSSFVLFHHCA